MKNRYTLFILIVSISVATLIHFPELVSLFDVFESQTLFPGMRPADVASEVFFTFISLVILFEVNILLFHFNQPAVKNYLAEDDIVIDTDLDFKQFVREMFCIPASHFRYSGH